MLDTKNLAGLVDIFTTNASYNPGTPEPTVNGIGSIQALLATIVPPGFITQNVVNTESITLSPPFDELGAAGTASGVVYATGSYIGQGDLAGQALIFFAKFEDKYVKTGDFALYGGWRISQRFFFPFESGPVTDGVGLFWSQFTVCTP